jgi:5-methylcytosine-specific restriction enzyme subunit McrC
MGKTVLNKQCATVYRNADVLLSSPKQSIVIDTKYYKETFSRRQFGLDTSQKIRSNNLYQIYSYIDNYTNTQDIPDITGILLYPEISSKIEAEYAVEGRKIKVASLNLDQDWKNIESDLLKIIH